MLFTQFTFQIPAFSLLLACLLHGSVSSAPVTEKSWKKKELRDAANTMKVIIENKDDFAKVLAEILKEKEVINDAGTK